MDNILNIDFAGCEYQLDLSKLILKDIVIDDVAGALCEYYIELTPEITIFSEDLRSLTALFVTILRKHYQYKISVQINPLLQDI